MRMLVAMFMLISSHVMAQRCQSALVVSYNGDWKPYFYQFGSSQYDGIDFTLLRDVITDMDCELIVLPMTEARSIIELGKGSFDISIGASFTPERAERFFYSEPYRQEKIGVMFFNKSKHDKRTSLESVLEDGGIVGINMSGYFGSKVEGLKTRFPNQFVHGFSLPERIAMLTHGEIDAIVDDRGALCHQMKGLRVTHLTAVEEQASDLVLSDETLHDNNVYFLFSRLTVDDAFVRTFNEKLARVVTSSSTADGQCY